MPTAAKLAGAVMYALFGWYMAGIATPYFPFGSAPTFWIPGSIAVGVFVGWRICGPRAGRGAYAAIGNGLTTTAVMTLMLLFGLGFYRMVRKAFQMIYDGTMEAIQGVFAETVAVALLFYNGPLITNLIVGGVLCAWIVEYFARRYP